MLEEDYYHLSFKEGCTEVERAFLTHFQERFLNKVFIRIKIARKLKFYILMIVSGSKSVKKGQWKKNLNFLIFDTFGSKSNPP